MSQAGEARIPRIDRFGTTVDGKDWVQTGAFQVAFWLDYNGHWEPDGVFAELGASLEEKMLTQELIDLVEDVAKSSPEIFFSVLSSEFSLSGSELSGVTRILFIGSLATLYLDDCECKHTFILHAYRVLERKRIPTTR